MSRPCFCDGTNDSCRFCGGTGILPDDLDSLSGHTHYEFASKTEGNAGEHPPKEHSGFLPAELVMGPKAYGRSGRRKNRKSYLIGVQQPRLKSSPSASLPFERILSTDTESLPSMSQKDFLSSIGQCPNCGSKYRKDVLERHIPRCSVAKVDSSAISKSHAATPLVRADQHSQETNPHPTLLRTSSPERRYEVCPVCNVIVRFERFERHMLKVHKTKYSPPPGTVTQLPNFSLQMVTCSKCGAKVRPELLGRHFRKSHSVLKKKKKKRKKGKSHTKREPRLVSGGLPGLGKRR